MSAIGDEYLPVVEACGNLGISRRTMNRYIEEGLIASVKHGGRLFISRRAIEDYWARQERAGDLKRAAAEKARRRGGVPTTTPGAA
jgi:excisionase family DNA binding protein